MPQTRCGPAPPAGRPGHGVWYGIDRRHHTLTDLLPQPPAGRTVRARCPQPACAGKRGESLAITGDDDGGGYRWHCHRCGWSGGRRDQKPSGPAPATKPRDRALKVWRETVAAPGTLTDLYLRDRGVADCIIPASIRHHPCLPYWHDRRRLGHWPALVARVDDLETGAFLGLHRIYLDPTIDANPARKAVIAEPLPVKKTLGRVAGGGVSFGPISRRHACFIGEGIETVGCAVSLRQRSGIAALGSEGLRALKLPAEARLVVILVDDDVAGRSAAHDAARRWSTEGRKVYLSDAGRG